MDGHSPAEGRLQVHHRGRWHSVCTASRNWTAPDVGVACRQLGYSGGSWARWYPRNNASRQLLLESPNCNSNEKQQQQLEGCPGWAARRVGSGVCDYHQDIGLR